MRTLTGLAITFALSLPACGASDSTAPSVPSNSKPGGFNPPPAAEGYQRLVAATIPDVQPGSDVTYCQYVMRAFDHDVDIIDHTGHQSHYGHHVVAFSFADDGTQEIGSS